MLVPNSILLSRYCVLRELGRGGMGTVYEALDQSVSCIVALKETSAGNDREARLAFEREAALLANLRHSALPKVMHYFSENGGDFLVMEFIPGYDLAELLELRGAPFPQAQVMRWADELLKVLEYLHRQEPPILHRDIKPSNLKLTKQGEIFLLDFGLAKGSAGQMPMLETSRSVRGYTPVYASLEQIHGRGSDPRSDLYSVAATLYHLLTDTPPVDAPSRFNQIEDEHPDPLPLIETLNPHVSANVAAVVHRAMSVNRKQRPTSASEMRKALRNAIEEDEHHAAEEEFGRADAMRQQRETARRKADEEAARKAEEERQLREAETRQLEEARRREEVAARRAAVERQQREEQVRHKDEERKSQEAEQERKKAEVAEAEQRRKQAEEQARREAAEEAKFVAEAEFMRADEEQRLRLTELNREKAAKLAELERSEAKRPALVKTIPAPFVPARLPLPDKLDSPDETEDDRAREVERRHANEPKLSKPWTLNKRVMAGAALVVALVAGGTGVWWWASNRSPAGMAYVPGGVLIMGRDLGDKYEYPAHRVTVKPFFIDIYEVTREDYKKCVDAHMCPVPQGWSNGTYPGGTQRQPVTGVTLNGAWDYAKWVGKRLPFEEEWEFAARGTDGRRYPWGNDWKPDLANADGASNGLAGVGNFKGESPYGVFDMAGNAWEWTASNWAPYPGWTFPSDRVSDDAKVIRGGYYLSTGDQVTTTYRRGYSAQRENDYSNTGFRCVKELE